jgi:hypothetical protein
MDGEANGGSLSKVNLQNFVIRYKGVHQKNLPVGAKPNIQMTENRLIFKPVVADLSVRA